MKKSFFRFTLTKEEGDEVEPFLLGGSGLVQGVRDVAAAQVAQHLVMGLETAHVH